MRYILLIIISLITILILWINLKLYSENYTLKEKKDDIVLQLNFLENELKNNDLGNRMQKIYPEGYVFINALYGLSWCELALCDSSDTFLKEKAVNEAIYAYNAINSDRARLTFDSTLKPVYGIFYCGWRNYLLSKILSIDTTFSDYQKYSGIFRSQCDSIEKALTESNTPYLESYPGSSWPADMFVDMASLSIHDKIYNPKYDNVINDWIHNVKERLDAETNLLPHKVDSKNGKSIQGARGSSMSLMLRMLVEINRNFANEQYKIFKDKFISKTFGIPYVREYPDGKNGSEDIDSGPVIFGIGFAGTIVTIGTSTLYDNIELSEKLYMTINAFGFPKISGNQKRYLFGKHPMGDAFIAWGRASGLRQLILSSNPITGIFIEFNIISFVLVIVIWIAFFWKKIKKAVIKHNSL
jgi:hypothetical protein